MVDTFFVDQVTRFLALALLAWLAWNVLKHRNLLVAWILILGTFQLSLSDENSLFSQAIGWTLSILLSVALVRLMQVIARNNELEATVSVDALTEQANRGIMATDRDGVIVSWNKQSEKLFGKTPDEAIGMCLEDLFRNGSKARIRKLLSHAIKGHECTEHMELRRYDDKQIPVLVHTRPAWREGKVIGMLMVSTPAARRSDDA